ncbi:MAG TPA: hypothetical protein VG433_00985 [Pirellulales bacterium]|nr:hypothetical protein [Pirellulales bacterium]
MKRAVAAILTLALVLAALWFGRPAPEPDSSAATPGECIDRMFAAGERGDVDAYLACFTGEQRMQLEREVAAQPRENFASGLVAAIEPLKGRAIVHEAASALTAEITVERVYAHRNDLQLYNLQCQDGRWQIAAVRPVQALQPPVPYGTPVFEMPEDTAQSGK